MLDPSDYFIPSQLCNQHCPNIFTTTGLSDDVSRRLFKETCSQVQIQIIVELMNVSMLTEGLTSERKVALATELFVSLEKKYILIALSEISKNSRMLKIFSSALDGSARMHNHLELLETGSSGLTPQQLINEASVLKKLR